MQILHGSWIPETENSFIQTGQFYLWVETSQKKKSPPQSHHPWQLTKSDFAKLLTSELGIKAPEFYSLEDLIEPCYFLLPTVDGQPLPSLELSRYLEFL